jgi:L-threonylcarbamoyladenylate synthase
VPSQTVQWRTGSSPASEALAVLRTGGVLIYPTETVYGIGTALSAGDAGIERVRVSKGAPKGRPYLLLVADSASAFALWSRVPEQARLLAARYWPGPLTLIGPAAAGLPASLLGSEAWNNKQTPTVSVRVPGHERLRSLLEALGEPLLSTSANRSGQSTPVRFSEVDVSALAADLVIDAGDCAAGLPSTLVSLLHDPPLVLRQGSVVLEARP